MSNKEEFQTVKLFEKFSTYLATNRYFINKRMDIRKFYYIGAANRVRLFLAMLSL